MHKFDRLEVSLARREVYLDGIPQSISMRAFDILELLIAADGGIVSKDAILAAVWPHAVVIDNNIQVHVSALRKLFGSKAWIKTIAGRGYRLAAADAVDARDTPLGSAPVALSAGPVRAHADLADLATTRARTNTALSSTEGRRGPLLIGRESMIDELEARFAEEALLTLIGPGGAGKSALAFAFARGWCARTGARLVCIDLAAEPEHANNDGLCGRLCGCGGHIEQESREAVPRHWPAYIDGPGPILLLLESCERDLDAAIVLCQRAMTGCSEIRVMATSREPLGIAGESPYRVDHLPVPAVNATEAEARRSPSVQLFLKRGRVLNTQEGEAAFPISMVATVCRLLDGLPLAIELAAQRAELIGLCPLLTQLDGCMLTLSNGVRSAPRRHRSLQAMLQWSYDLLSDAERAVLRRLCLFDQPFSLGAARSAVSCSRLHGEAVFHALYGLIEKSLVDTETRLAPSPGASKRYTMFRATRQFALEKLIKAGEANWLMHTKNVDLVQPVDISLWYAA